MSGPRAPLLAVIGGRGGAGASTLAAALAVRAVQESWRVALFDFDSRGGGLDLVVGETSERVLRPEVYLAAGYRDGAAIAPETATRSLVDALAAFDLVVADVGRPPGEAGAFALSLATTTLLVVPAEFRACAAAAGVLRQIEAFARDIRLVVRGPGPGRLSPRAVEESLGIPLAGYLRSEAAVARALETGEPPGRSSGSLRRLVGRLLADLVPPGSGDVITT